MPQSFAEDLGSILMTAHLSESLERARRFAREQSHRLVTLEHLLLALTEDPDAALVLQAGSVDILRLRADVSGYLGRLLEDMRADVGAEPRLDGELVGILKAAAAAAQRSRKPRIDGAVVLAAIAGDGRSPSAGLLKAHGLTFEEAIKALQKAHVQARAKPEAPAPGASSAQKPQPASGREASAAARGELARQNPAPGWRSQSAEEILAAARARIAQRATSAAKSSAPTRTASPKPAAPVAKPQPATEAPAETATKPAEQPGPEAKEATGAPTKISEPAPEAPPQAQPAVKNGATANATEPAQPAPPAAPAPAPAAAEPQPPPAEPAQAASDRLSPQLPLRPLKPGEGPPRPPLPPQPNWALQTTAAAPASAPSLNGNLGVPYSAVEHAAPSGPLPRVAPGRARAVGFARGSLIERRIPRRMRIGRPKTVEVRIARDRLDSLTPALDGRDPARRPGAVLTRAVSVRLRAPDGGLRIENASPETQWVEDAHGLLHDDYASWRWTVTPNRRGRRRLQIVTSVRTIGRDGMAAEFALPVQMVDVRVGSNLGRVVVVWSALVAPLASAWLLGRYWDQVLEAVVALF
jgi:hypothetical protein